MPTSTVIGRVRGEFFPVMAPGLYVLSVITCAFVAIGENDRDRDDLWQQFYPLVDKITTHWPLSIVAIMGAYLLGSLLMTIPVSIAERVSKAIFGWTIRGWVRDLYIGQFPYKTAFKIVVKSLKLDKRYVIDNNTNLHVIFNYYKTVLCQEVPEAFALIREYEGRVRLFVGSFWAGGVGIIVAATMFILIQIREIDELWMIFVIILFSVSSILFAMFGRQITRLRGQEAEHVYLAYLTHLVKSGGTDCFTIPALLDDEPQA